MEKLIATILIFISSITYTSEPRREVSVDVKEDLKQKLDEIHENFNYILCDTSKQLWSIQEGDKPEN